MAETTSGDSFKGVHLEEMGVVVGFRWLYIRSEEIKKNNKKKQSKRHAVDLF